MTFIALVDQLNLSCNLSKPLKVFGKWEPIFLTLWKLKWKCLQTRDFDLRLSVKIKHVTKGLKLDSHLPKRNLVLFASMKVLEKVSKMLFISS